MYSSCAASAHKYTNIVAVLMHKYTNIVAAHMYKYTNMDTKIWTQIIQHIKINTSMCVLYMCSSSIAQYSSSTHIQRACIVQ